MAGAYHANRASHGHDRIGFNDSGIQVAKPPLALREPSPDSQLRQPKVRGLSGHLGVRSTDLAAPHAVDLE